MVNGHDVEVCDHYEAVNIMREAGSQLRLEVSREVTRIVPEKVGVHENKKRERVRERKKNMNICKSSEVAFIIRCTISSVLSEE